MNTPNNTPLNCPDVIALLDQMVRIKSLSREEGPIADFLESWLQDHGLKPRRIDNNVIVEVIGEEPGPVFLLNSHLDTVPAAAGWECDPWTPVYNDKNEMMALGAVDAKGCLSAMACGLVGVARRGLRRGRLMLAATVMEEIGRGGMDVIRPQLGQIDAGLIGEPTSLEGAIAQGGLLLIEGTAKGRASHAARAHLGVNALTIAARDILKVDAYEFDRIHPHLGPTMVNMTVIQGGKRHNVIPDRCEFTLDVRTTPSYQHEEIFEMLQAHLESDLKIRSKRLRPVEIGENALLVRSLRGAHPRELVTFGSPTMSDWAHLRDMQGVKFGPGESQRSHTPHEAVPLDEVREAAQIYGGCAWRFLEATDDGEHA